jgi:16S rRNA (adenine1518-N6/adenine1519-N6)-dimethyltransferase
MNHRQVRDFFALHHTRPKKQLGQNFLVNPEALKIILAAGALTDTDTVIEIGAGLGCLTDVLARRARRVIAVEVDELLYKALAAQFSTNSHVHLLNADILKLELNSLLSDGTETTPTTFKADGTKITPTTFKVIANLPYSITTPILWKLLDYHKQIHSCVLMTQKEVAERIVAEPGGKDYGALTIGVTYRTDATLIATLSPENFYPAPKVDSALLKLTMRQHPKVKVENEEFFFKVVRTAFRTRRKMLKNTLVRSRLASAKVLAAAFEELGIAPERRAETLDITEFAALANFLFFHY